MSEFFQLLFNAFVVDQKFTYTLFFVALPKLFELGEKFQLSFWPITCNRTGVTESCLALVLTRAFSVLPMYFLLG